MARHSWFYIAQTLEKDYGIHVDYEEGFFICPECGEPIYEDDYDLLYTICPICEEPFF